MTRVRVLAGFLSFAVLGSAARGQSAPAAPQTLREVLGELRVPVEPTSLPGLDRAVTSFVVDTSADLFAIAFYDASPDSLCVATFDRTTRRWRYAALDRESAGVAPSGVGALMGIHHSRRSILVDTHINPSAGTIVVLSRSLTRVASLPGWVIRVLPTDVVLYHRNSVHFAPTHRVELWTWDPVTHRDARLYPHAGSDSARLDSRLGDTVVVARSGRTLAFTVTSDVDDGTRAERPPLGVVVVCREVGASRERCTERLLADVLADHPGRSVAEVLTDFVGVR